MLKVIPLRYGTIFKKAFRDPMVFSRFASDVLGMPIEASVAHREFSYGTPVGQYRFERDVFTLVVLTTAPRGRELKFSVAVSDMDPVNEQGQRLGVFRHRLVFLNPKVINAQTPPGVRAWLELIADSLDGEDDETRYPDPALQRVLRAAEKSTVTPEELARIKDEAAWEVSKADARSEGRAEGRAEGKAEGRAEGLRLSVLAVFAARGLPVSDAARERVAAEEDVATLEAWLRVAVIAATAEEALR
ncbi:MAG: hypothetical protein U0324_15690 [Polyangiales bacterium]